MGYSLYKSRCGMRRWRILTGFRDILSMNCTEIFITTSMLLCVCMCLCRSGRVQKVPTMRQNAKWSKVQICVCLCVFEVPQRYQILADMPNWTYCRLGGWRGPSDHLATMCLHHLGTNNKNVHITKTKTLWLHFFINRISSNHILRNSIYLTWLF